MLLKNIREIIPLTSNSLVPGRLSSGGSDVRHVVQVCDSAAFIHQHAGIGLCPKWQEKETFFCVLPASSGAQHRSRLTSNESLLGLNKARSALTQAGSQTLRWDDRRDTNENKIPHGHHGQAPLTGDSI